MGDKKHSKEYKKKEPWLDKAPRSCSKEHTYLFLEPYKTVLLYGDKHSTHRPVEGISYSNLNNQKSRVF